MGSSRAERGREMLFSRKGESERGKVKVETTIVKLNIFEMNHIR